MSTTLVIYIACPPEGRPNQLSAGSVGDGREGDWTPPLMFGLL
jgi:hypothetical protein